MTITNLLDGSDEALSVDTTGTLITSEYNETTGELTLSGTDTVANYEQVLRTLSYNNASQSPDEATRLIEITVSDGLDDSITRISSVSVVGVNDSPDLATIDDQVADVGQLIEIVVTATDPDGDSLTFQLDRDNPNSNIPDSATISSNGNTATISFTPATEDGTGPFTFVVLVTDDANLPLSDSEQFQLSVNPPGSAPVVDLD